VVTGGTAWAEASREPLAVRGQRAARRAQPCPEKEVFATALLLALRAYSIFDLHAAAAVAPELTVIAVGAPASGKTTLCAALLEAGCHYLGDDRLLLRQLDGVPELLSFPAPFRLTAATARAFPRLEPWLSSDLATGKRELDLERAFPARHAARATGRRCLLFPERAPSSELSVLGPSESLGRLIAQSASLVVAGHPAPKAQLAALRALAQGSLTLRARLGPEWLTNPAGAALMLLEQLERFG
jgi:hypothetical protein